MCLLKKKPCVKVCISLPVKVFNKMESDRALSGLSRSKCIRLSLEKYLWPKTY